MIMDVFTGTEAAWLITLLGLVSTLLISARVAWHLGSLRRHGEAPVTLCRAELGCGELAVRYVYDRLMTQVPGCSRHGRDM